MKQPTVIKKKIAAFNVKNNFFRVKKEKFCVFFFK